MSDCRCGSRVADITEAQFKFFKEQIIDHMVDPQIFLEFKFRELVRQTARIGKTRGLNCHNRRVKEDIRNLTWEYHVTCGESYSNPSGHRLIVTINTDKMTADDVKDVDRWHVKTTCGCEAYNYWGSDVLAGRNGYMLPPPTSNQQLPKRNLHMKDGTHWSANLLCKHILNVAPNLRGRWNDKKEEIQKVLRTKVKGAGK